MVQHYATDLGYEYLTASNKDEFNKVIDHFLKKEITGRPMLLEVFTDGNDESVALERILNFCVDPKLKFKNTAKEIVKNIIGEKNIKSLKTLIK